MRQVCIALLPSLPPCSRILGSSSNLNLAVALSTAFPSHTTFLNFSSSTGAELSALLHSTSTKRPHYLSESCNSSPIPTLSHWDLTPPSIGSMGAGTSTYFREHEPSSTRWRVYYTIIRPWLVAVPPAGLFERPVRGRSRLSLRIDGATRTWFQRQNSTTLPMMKIFLGSRVSFCRTKLSWLHHSPSTRFDNSRVCL